MGKITKKNKKKLIIARNLEKVSEVGACRLVGTIAIRDGEDF